MSDQIQDRIGKSFAGFPKCTAWVRYRSDGLGQPSDVGDYYAIKISPGIAGGMSINIGMSVGALELFADSIAAYLNAARPEPSGDVVERVAAAIYDVVDRHAGLYPESFQMNDFVAWQAAQAALSVILAEIEAEKQAIKDSPDGRAGNGFPHHRIEALDRLTARLKGESHD